MPKSNANTSQSGLILAVRGRVQKRCSAGSTALATCGISLPASGWSLGSEGFLRDYNFHFMTRLLGPVVENVLQVVRTWDIRLACRAGNGALRALCCTHTLARGTENTTLAPIRDFAASPSAHPKRSSRSSLAGPALDAQGCVGSTTSSAIWDG